MVVSLYDIFTLFQDEPKLLQKGEMIFQTGQVSNVKYARNVVSCYVSTNHKKNTYKVTASITEEGIHNFSCNCQKAKFKCHHLAALLFHANRKLTADDMCEWADADADVTDNKLLTIEEIFQMNKSFDAVERKVTDEDQLFLYNALKGKQVGFRWLISPEYSQSHVEDIPTVRDVLLSEHLAQTRNKEEYVTSVLQLSDEQRNKIIQSTIGQRENPLWNTYRANRITSSSFGMVIQAIDKSKYPQALFKSLTGCYECVPLRLGMAMNVEMEVKWMLQNRFAAAELYCTAMEVELTETGLWLHPSGLFSCSPDYLVGDDKLLDIKCPWKWRSVSVLKEAWKDKDFFVEMNDGEFGLKKDHVYFHQVQGMLHITKRKSCDVIVWTPNEAIILSVPIEMEWESNFEKLSDFYKTQLLPKLLECS